MDGLPVSQTGRVSDDDSPTLPVDPRRAGEADRPRPIGSTSNSRFPVEVTVLGVAIIALLIAAIVTLLSINGGDGGVADDQLTIGSEPGRPTPTFDASISDADEPAGRDIGITDEPIVIDAEGNVVDPAGGNAGAALPSEAVGDATEGGLDLPDDVFTGVPAEGSGPVATAASSDEDEQDADDGTNLLGGDDPEDKLMPDLICRGLQAAQDEIQDHGVFGSKSKDATGRGRRQLWDRNWVVVAQDPEPGEKIGEFEAILYVVKKGDDENICD